MRLSRLTRNATAGPPNFTCASIDAQVGFEFCGRHLTARRARRRWISTSAIRSGVDDAHEVGLGEPAGRARVKVVERDEMVRVSNA